MEFLTQQEKSQLQQLLINQTSLCTSDMEFRSALLTNCGLGKYSSLIALDKPLQQFVITLCAKLSEVYIQVNNLERLGLIVFLEYIKDSDNILNKQDKLFVEYVINRWEQWQEINAWRKNFQQQNSPEYPILENINWHCDRTITVRSGGFFSTVFSAAVNTVIFSNDGKTLISASEDWNEPIKLWNPTTGGEIRLMGTWKLGRFASIAISPNGKILVIGGTIIELCNLATQQKIAELGSLIGHRDIAALAISPDNDILASSSLGESPFNFRDYSIKLWRLNTKENICTLNGHSARVNSLAFSGDGQTLASASKDSKIKLWNLNTLKETYTLTGHQGQ